MILTSSYGSDLLPLIKEWAGEAVTMPLYYDKIVKVEPTTEAYHVEALFDSLGLLQRKNEGQAISYDDSKEIFKPVYQPAAYALGFMISKEAVDDGRAMLRAERFTKMLRNNAIVTREQLCHDVYNNAFAAAAVLMSGNDGKTLVASDHPAHTGTQSNLITGGSVDISEAALEQLRIDVRNTETFRGIRTNIMIDKLLVGLSDEATANRILKSVTRVATADHDLNFLRADNSIPGGVVASPYFTDAGAFFVTTTAMDGPKLLVRQDIEVDQSGDFDTKNAKFSIMMRICTGWTDWRGVYGSAGA